MAGGGRAEDRAHVWIFPPALLLLCIGVGLALDMAEPQPALPMVISIPVGVASIVAGVVIDQMSQAVLRAAATAVHPDHSSTAIVDQGPFRISRNPIYFAQGLLLVGSGFLVGRIAFFGATALWFAVIHFGVIRPEEAYLLGKFGEAYNDYRRRVRRWF